MAGGQRDAGGGSARERLDLAANRVLVTGAAGFIGYHFSKRLLDDGVEVAGLDNLNDYYDPAIKHARLSHLAARRGFTFHQGDLADREGVAALFAQVRPTIVVHLAAQAGVRYSVDNPFAYADSNLLGFLSVLDGCRAVSVKHLVYASSSSVYGGNTRLPFSTEDRVDHPVSLYAATKKANELMAHSYSHLHGIPSTGLRFFTVYGRYGRPDMAYWKFTEAIHDGRPITINNHGDMSRDFTHVDDIVEAMVRLVAVPAAPDPGFDPERPTAATSWAPHRVYNIGAHRPEQLLDMVAIIERHLGRAADKRMQPMPPGDVKATFADVADLEAAIGFTPKIGLEDGLGDFVAWYREWRLRNA